MELFGFNQSDMLSYFLTLFRISTVLFLMPFFGGNSIPKPVKAALVLVLSMALWPQLSFPGSLMPTGWNIVIMFIGELILGLILGLLVNFLFAAVQLGGQIIGFQMGFAMVNVMDPITGTSNAVSAHFLYMCTMLTFLVLNGHLFLLKAVGMSFEHIPPGTLLLNPTLANDIFKFSNLMFTLAIKIAAPVMAALFLVDLSLALISRAAPQLHVLVLGFPIKITVGFFFLGFIFSIMSIYVSDYLQGLNGLFENVMRFGASVAP
ncbi:MULTISPECIES: flagellar biosynthetic protein FliR [unclassified Pseudodesulfovibrio]|uniref:flagellar biosynthetic protein FliR n=1 Tax=unclassified Pseudodesulfovibrio TaxID=2661612 RepID=UPI000FEBF4DF|nr:MULTISPECIES: flagellar biosynthetic protein FliR [unclassified Pseudodesulfovibrio]MCJ2164026.1 flagellar biosynthetic protein FliR [Pseudodesulfovibrio sp. S3-i]RWU05338.1 flagellar biosynthetic protein FliR [Pseudodesulfovibrio sp. S3]